MSALRPTDDCDLYVYKSGRGWECCEAPLPLHLMKGHIESHIRDGANVPDNWEQRLDDEDAFIQAGGARYGKW